MPIVVEHNGHEYAIVSNGEFFNYEALRAELSAAYQFTTHSDTEVALAAYLAWGDACVEHLLGQFAFVVYDGARNRVFFARDRIGIKPLYYALADGSLVIASEPKGVLAHPDVVPVPDKEALAAFVLGSISMTSKCEPLDRSLFEGVRALPPGTRASFSAQGLTLEKYWDVTFPPHRSAGEVVDGLRHQVSRAVKEQVPREVPYGVLLSGGLDSGIIAALIAAQEPRPIAAVSVRYKGQPNADYEHARPFARELKLPLVAPEISGEELVAGVDAFVRALDRPSDSSRNMGLVAMYRTLAAQGAKVALIGEGSDECNLGYYYTMPGFADKKEEYNTAENFRALQRAYAATAARFFNPQYIDAAAFEAVIDEHVREYYDRADIADPLVRMQYFYATRFLKGRLDTHDRLAMAQGVEARVPFCDEEVVRVSLSAKPEDNLSEGSEKMLLRRALGGMVNPDIRNRRKSPLPESKSASMQRAVLTAFESALNDADGSTWEVFNKEFAQEMLMLGRRHVEALERGEASAPQPGAFRMRNVFLHLTLLRWHKLYFVSR